MDIWILSYTSIGLKKVFLKFANKDRPLLLIQDGHGSHLTPDLIDEARANKVEILCLPPHTTYVLQPLGKVIYGPLKKNYSATVTTPCYAKKDFIVSKNDLARVFCAPFEKTFKESKHLRKVQ